MKLQFILYYSLLCLRQKFEDLSRELHHRNSGRYLPYEITRYLPPDTSEHVPL